MRNIFARSILAGVALFAFTLGAFAPIEPTLKVNQTEGFAEGQSLALHSNNSFTAPTRHLAT